MSPGSTHSESMGATGLPQDRSGQKPKAGGILAFSRKNQEDAPSDDMPFTKRRVAIILARLVLKVATVERYDRAISRGNSVRFNLDCVEAESSQQRIPRQ